MCQKEANAEGTLDSLSVASMTLALLSHFRSGSVG